MSELVNTEDRKNPSDLICQICQTVILKANMATLTNKEVRLVVYKYVLLQTETGSLTVTDTDCHIVLSLTLLAVPVSVLVSVPSGRVSVAVPRWVAAPMIVSMAMPMPQCHGNAN